MRDGLLLLLLLQDLVEEIILGQRLSRMLVDTCHLALAITARNFAAQAVHAFSGSSVLMRVPVNLALAIDRGVAAERHVLLEVSVLHLVAADLVIETSERIVNVLERFLQSVLHTMFKVIERWHGRHSEPGHLEAAHEVAHVRHMDHVILMVLHKFVLRQLGLLALSIVTLNHFADAVFANFFFAVLAARLVSSSVGINRRRERR